MIATTVLTVAAMSPHMPSSRHALRELPLARSSQPARVCSIRMAGAIDTLRQMQGPEIFWGAEGVALGYEESAVKGHDNFDHFIKDPEVGVEENVTDI